MRIQPSGDRVLIQRLPPEERTAAGLYLPAAGVETAELGIVIDQGEGEWKPELKEYRKRFEIGDKVMVPKHSGCPVEAMGKQFFIYFGGEIIGKVIEE